MLTCQFLTVREVADLLKVGEVTVRHWIKEWRTTCHRHRPGMAYRTQRSWALSAPPRENAWTCGR